MSQVLVQIEKVISAAPPYEPQGKTYSVYEYTCSGHIAGVYNQSFIVKTLSGKAASYIDDGLQFNADIDVYQGKTKYVVPKAMYHEGGVFSQMNPNAKTGQAPAAPAPAAPAPAPAPLPPPPAAPPPPPATPAAPPAPAVAVATAPPPMSFDAMANIHLSCYQKACDLYANLPIEQMIAVTATLFIECNKKGIRPTAQVVDDNVPFGEPLPTAPPAPPLQPAAGAPAGAMNDAMVANMMTTITPVLVEGGNLMARVTAMKGLGSLTDRMIVGWYVTSQGNNGVFKIKVNNELMELGG